METRNLHSKIIVRPNPREEFTTTPKDRATMDFVKASNDAHKVVQAYRFKDKSLNSFRSYFSLYLIVTAQQTSPSVPFDTRVDLENLLMQMGHDSEIDVASNEMILRELIVLKLPKEVEDFMFNLYKTMYFSVNQIKEGLQHILNYMDRDIEGNSHKGSQKASCHNYSVALPTATVTVKSEDGQFIPVRCLFDSGSQHSFIHKELANKLGIRIVTTVDMILNSFDSMGNSKNYEIVNPVVSLGNRKMRVSMIVVENMPELIVTPGLCETMRDLDRRGYRLADKDIRSDRIDNIQMFIGSDFLGRYLSGMRQVNNVDLFESPGGYLVYGLIPHKGIGHIHCNSAFVARVSVESGEIAPLLAEPRTLNPAVIDDTLPVHKLWDLDVVGIIPSQVSPSDVKTISKYETTVLYSNGRYWVELPFKHNHPFLPTNYNIALAQMYNQVKRFQRQPELLKCYDSIIKEQLNLDFIEEVENPVVSPNTHYLPHHAVSKDSSTTPLRVVYNCSARVNQSSASLNDCLMTGPSLTEKLFDLLVRFRMNKFACIADIEKAFLQIGLQPHHRDFTRFLWLENPFDQDSTVKTYRFKSVLFGATCSPFLLQMTLQYRFQISSSPYSDVFLSSFYVDNFQYTTGDEQELVKLYDVANDTHYPRISAFLRKELNSLEQDKLTFIKDIGLYYDEYTGLVHSRGRLHHSNLDQNTKFPILIPLKSHLTSLLIDYAHEKCLHGGVKDTLSYLRRQYWIPKVISTIKKFLRHCVICKRVGGSRFDYPGPPPLPAVRVQFIRPFAHTGIDFSGPITITETDDGKPHKYYIVLFTCTASRLVHLELASNMSASMFINIVRRFCAIYSAPVSVISDNGSNFLVSAKVFSELLIERDVKEYMAVNRIQWKFIAPRAP
ncbi:uncharacterized protein [Macrobrachium rosenbergii]|uniref:uncharacterized protein n=1 Tax=Macrobrachium rosenbergii TaxID=79674 RepID=UPI0034D5700A